MTLYELHDARMIRTLRDAYGDDIVLFDEQEESTVFRIVAEFSVGGREYAVLQSEELKKEGEVAIYRIIQDGQGKLELETIEDDDEWENVSEIYDEMTFPVEKEEENQGG